MAVHSRLGPCYNLSSGSRFAGAHGRGLLNQLLWSDNTHHWGRSHMYGSGLQVCKDLWSHGHWQQTNAFWLVSDFILNCMLTWFSECAYQATWCHQWWSCQLLSSKLNCMSLALWSMGKVDCHAWPVNEIMNEQARSNIMGTMNMLQLLALLFKGES